MELWCQINMHREMVPQTRANISAGANNIYCGWIYHCIYSCHGTTIRQNIMCLQSVFVGHFTVATENWLQSELLCFYRPPKQIFLLHLNPSGPATRKIKRERWPKIDWWWIILGWLIYFCHGVGLPKLL